MAFPTSSLTNNQVHKEGSRTFVYDSALGVWDQVRETDRTDNKIFSGEIGSGVTFPSGHIISVKRSKYTGGGEYVHSGTNTKIMFPSSSFEAISGRIYTIIMGSVFCGPYREAGTQSVTHQDNKMWVGTIPRSQGNDTSPSVNFSTQDTKIAESRTGHYHDSSSGSTNLYQSWTAIGYFTAASSATHYVHLSTQPQSGNIAARMAANTQYPLYTIIYEILP